MKLSKLNYDKLTEDEKYELIMNGISDLSKEEVSDKNKADIIVVLGCTPVPLEARIKKTMQLYNKGYARNILLAGGDGWQKLYKKKDPNTGKIYIDEAKKRELLEAIKNTINANLLGDNPSQKQIELFQRFNEGMNKMMLTNEVKSFEEKQDDYKLNLDEAEFMKLMILSNGGLKGAKIFHEPFSYDTKENMQNTKSLIDGLLKRGEIEKLDRIIVVTSSFHCRRAMLTFKKYFSNIDIITCPATDDLEKRGISLGRDMLKNEYYKKQLDNESKALINYSRNGSIADIELGEILPNDIMETIVRSQKSGISREEI